MKQAISVGMLLLLAAAILAAGCTSSQTADSPSAADGETGRITISGAFALYPMMVKWAEEYQKLHPDVKIEISAGGAGKGMTDTLAGMVDLGMISREISNEEAAKGAVWVAVTKDAVVPTVNADNPALTYLQAQGISKPVFTQIYINGSVTTWGEVVGRPEITDPINLYTRSDSCGAADIWAKYMGYAQENLKGVGVYGDPGLADAVRQDPLGTGYNNIGFAYDASTGTPLEGLAIIPLDLNDNGKVDPDEQVYATRDDIVAAINDGTYPSPPARELNVAAKDRFSGASKEFIRWILTDGQQYVQESGYIALPPDRISQQLEKLDA